MTPARRAAEAVFIVPMRCPRKGNTQTGCRPRWAWTIDHAASFRITTWSRLDLKDAAGTMNTLRPISGTLISQSHSRTAAECNRCKDGRGERSQEQATGANRLVRKARLELRHDRSIDPKVVAASRSHVRNALAYGA